MCVKIITDMEFIEQFIFGDPEMVDRLSDDYTDHNQFFPQFQMWVGFYEDNVFKAILSVEKVSSVVLKVHIHIPNIHRGERSFHMANVLLKWVEKHSDSRYVKINAEIPEYHKDVIRFAEKNGFKIFGVDEKSHMKNGKLHSRVFLTKPIKR